MEPRMKSPALTLAGVRDAMLKIAKATEDAGVPPATLELVSLRVGQINGCAVCLDMHARIMKKRGESDARIYSVAVWRETPYYTESERAALALAEAATRMSDRSDAVPDAIWKQAAAHFDEKALAGLVTAIAMANAWNRLNVSTGQVTGEWIAQYI